MQDFLSVRPEERGRGGRRYTTLCVAHCVARRLRRITNWRPAIPRISFFYGIAIFMYWNEGVHAQPHFHARYAGVAASLAFDGTVIAGSLPRRAHALVAEWAELHGDELLANWERARRDEPLELIEPLS
jgi:hypothetical protein